MNKTLLSSLLMVSLSATTNVAMAQLAQNGDFELGDTSGWLSFPTATSTFDVTSDANSGSFAGVIDNQDQAAGAVVKQANLGIGSVSPGDQIRITFAAKGSVGPGGVVFAEFFSEIAGGGTSANEFLAGGPLPLTNDWQTFCFTTTAGPDVSGGVTLQMAAITGAVTGSFATVFVDDVTVTINELSSNGGFELGDTSSWQYFPGPNSTFGAIADPNTGSFAGELNNPDEAVGVVIKQANRGIGVVQTGDQLNVSFSAKATLGVGGVVFAEFFSEIAGGGTSANEILTGGPLPLTADFQDFNFTVTAGSDVSGGVTLQFVAATGAVTGSTVNLVIDDVKITTTGGSTTNFCSVTPNSVGTGAVISSSGSPSVSAQDFVIEASGMPAETFCLLFVGMDTVSSPSFEGRMCVGSPCRIGPILSTSASGTVSRALPDSVYTQFGCTAPTVGSQMNYQFIYRDTIGSGGNLTDALCVSFGL